MESRRARGLDRTRVGTREGERLNHHEQHPSIGYPTTRLRIEVERRGRLLLVQGVECLSRDIRIVRDDDGLYDVSSGVAPVDLDARLFSPATDETTERVIGSVAENAEANLRQHQK